MSEEWSRTGGRESAEYSNALTLANKSQRSIRFRQWIDVPHNVSKPFSGPFSAEPLEVQCEIVMDPEAVLVLPGGLRFTRERLQWVLDQMK